MMADCKMTKSNLILIGMPGCGKSTLGVLAAKLLCLSFLDTDLLIQQRIGKPLQRIINESGLNAFHSIECEVLSSVQTQNTLIATGGSAIYYPSAMEHLASVGTVVYLDSPLPLIKEHLHDFSNRGIAMPGGMTIDELYAERLPLYRKYADVICDVSSPDIHANVMRLLSSLPAGTFPVNATCP